MNWTKLILAQTTLCTALAGCGGGNSPAGSTLDTAGGVASSTAAAPTDNRVRAAAATADTVTVTAYEAEAGSVSGGATIQSSSVASGGRIVGHIVDVGSRVLLTVDGGAGGTATLVVRSSNGYASTSKLGLYVNGVRQVQLSFEPSGNWDTFVDSAAVPVTLVAGRNTIAIQHNSSDASSADIDRVSVSTSASAPVTTQAVSTVYEAEAGAVAGGANIQSATNASGGRIVGRITNVGARVQLAIAGGSGAAATLVIRTANGFTGTSKLGLYVNGVRQATLAFAPTGSWETFVDLAAVPVTLVAGSNTIAIQHDATDTGSADIDKITVAIGAAAPPPVISESVTTAYEAEAGSLSGGANIQTATNASGGRIVGNIVDFGSRMLLSVDGGSGGAGSVVIRMSNGYAGISKLGLYVNGVRLAQLSFAPTGNWESFVDLPAVAVTLVAGSNTIVIQHDAEDTSSADIDRITVTRPAATPDTQAPTPPSGLSLAGVTCISGTLSWAASTDNVAVAFYDIYHDGQKMTSVSGTTLSTLLTLTSGAKWGLYVNARDAAGNVSQASASLSVTVPVCVVDTEAPSTPTNLIASASGTTVSLAWSTSTDNVAVAAYDIYRNGVKVGSAPSLTFTDTGLAPSTAYRYALAARDAQGNVSAQSISVSVTTGTSCTTVVCSTTQIAGDTDVPWGLAALPDGSVIYSRRNAQDIVRLDPVTKVKTTLGTVPNVQGTDGEGGLLGLAVSPAFPDTDPWIYLYHTSPTDNRIVRIQYKSGKLDNTTLQVLLSGIERNKYHNGGRLRYGPDDKLYATTGDAQNGDNAQNTNNLNGKVLRMNPDGTVPSDNPFGNYVWSYGHRNPQGLAFDSLGRLWEQEFGNDLMDETNLIQKGGNYGWPNCEATISQAGSGCATPGYIAPKFTYLNYDASCSGIAIVRDVLYVACQRGTRVYRHVISGSSLTNVQQLYVGTYGRLRTIEPSTDGGLWLTTTNNPNVDSIANNSSEKIFKIVLGN